MKKNFSIFKLFFSERYLILALAKRDIATQFAGSLLGAAWSLLNPMITILIYWIVFSLGFKLRPDNNVPFIIWFSAGMCVWFFFADAVNGGVASIVSNSFLIKKTLCNPQILPVAKIVSGLFAHMIFLVIVIALIGLYHMPVSYIYLQFFYYLICLIVFAMGIGFLTSALNVFLRDLSHIVGILLQLFFWMTPIVWNLKMMPASIRIFFKLNPMYYIVQGYRDSLINFIPFWDHPGETIYFWVVALALFSGGTFVFNRLRPQFADLL